MIIMARSRQYNHQKRRQWRLMRIARLCLTTPLGSAGGERCSVKPFLLSDMAAAGEGKAGSIEGAKQFRQRLPKALSRN
jgi:hypothetical protein